MANEICYWDSTARKQKVRDATPEELAEIAERVAGAVARAAEAKLGKIAAERSAAFDAGMPYTFGEVQDVIQTRPQDQVNLLAISAKAARMVAAGITEPVQEFRAASDTSYWLTPEEALTLTDAAFAHGEAIYQTSWRRKNALAAIDLEAPDALEQIAAV